MDGGKARLIREVLGAPAEGPADDPADDLLWRACLRGHVGPRQATADKASGTLALIRALEEQGVRAYSPWPDDASRSPLCGKRDFAYDLAHDSDTCPGGTTLAFERLMKGERWRVYRADATPGNLCPLKERCTERSRGRTVVRSDDEASSARGRGYHETELYKKALRQRRVWGEPLFAAAQDGHGLRRFRLRRLWRVKTEALLIAAGQNLKRLLRGRGWGRRPWPGGARGLALGSPRRSSARVGHLSWLLLSPLNGPEMPLAPVRSEAHVRVA